MEIYSKYTDDELAGLLSQGDECAFTEIYNRFWERLYGLGLVKLKSTQAAEDIVQEVLSDLWHRRDLVKIESLSAYLATAVKYSVFKRIAHLEKERSAHALVASSQNSSEFNRADFHFLQELMRREISRLPEKCRIVFQYSREKKLSHKEISQKMNISQKMVEKHLTNALRKLKVSLRHTFSFFF